MPLLQRKENSHTMCSTERHGDIYVVTLTGPDEHRLNPTLISAVRSSLAQIKSNASQSNSPSTLILTAQGKFFSNGYDLTWAFTPDPATTGKSPSRAQQMSEALRSLVMDLVEFPMPTIAAVTGHAAAAGFVLAMCHDYVVMRKDKGFLYMSELDIGLKLPAWFMAVIKYKVGRPMDRREVVLRATKVTAERGMEMGVVDKIGDGVEGTMKVALELGKELVRKGWRGELYREIRKVLMKDVVDAIGYDESVEEKSGVSQGGIRSRM
ncbi:Enoyl-CoA delta isomerase 1, peroxisomal-like protein [Drosera capensis]